MPRIIYTVAHSNSSTVGVELLAGFGSASLSVLLASEASALAFAFAVGFLLRDGGLDGTEASCERAGAFFFPIVVERVW